MISKPSQASSALVPASTLGQGQHSSSTFDLERDSLLFHLERAQAAARVPVPSYTRAWNRPPNSSPPSRNDLLVVLDQVLAILDNEDDNDNDDSDDNDIGTSPRVRTTTARTTQVTTNTGSLQ